MRGVELLPEPLPPVLVGGGVVVDPAVAVSPWNDWNGESLSDGSVDSEAEAVAVPVAVAVAVAVAVCVAVAVAVPVAVAVAVAVAVCVAVAVAVCVAVATAQLGGVGSDALVVNSTLVPL